MTTYINCTKEEIKHGYPQKIEQVKHAVIDPLDVPTIKGDFHSKLFSNSIAYQTKETTNLK